MLRVHLHGNLKGKVSENVVFGMAWSLRWGLFAQKYERFKNYSPWSGVHFTQMRGKGFRKWGALSLGVSVHTL